ncbi:hypothetical protein FRB94_006496 [Tulasnella sp. JGI-2019a]|nr:hypothetical protein FRB94_006496 [Tulasnella sp. JGI-2019a]KAG8998968.1 hypothetical protein FRB93_013378 [Tulasnella sp. JGI-2019a]
MREGPTPVRLTSVLADAGGKSVDISEAKAAGDEAPERCIVFIPSVPKGITEGVLLARLSDCPDERRHPIYLCFRTTKNGRNRLIAFVEYPSPRQAEVAIKTYNGMILEDHQLTLMPCRPRGMPRSVAPAPTLRPGSLGSGSRYHPYVPISVSSQATAPAVRPRRVEPERNPGRTMGPSQSMIDYIPLGAEGNEGRRSSIHGRRIASGTSLSGEDSESETSDHQVAEPPSAAVRVGKAAEVGAADVEMHTDQRTFYIPDPDVRMNDNDQDDNSDSDVVEIPNPNWKNKPRRDTPAVGPQGERPGYIWFSVGTKLSYSWRQS